MNDTLICHFPVAPGLFASMYQDESDDGVIWVWMVDPVTDVPVRAQVALEELNQFVVALIGRYSPETVLM